ncbi:hypothetical protein EC973_008709 [Apophysomyces ossiformis]|uniref:ERT1/acuK family PAS domain-containing protein n=1 Tax=Apophysomyces ossiformis TaxID=679940 RepID=A0A8H7BSD5_9FUNG|nr:hypothetical protein EC973_008709 [Apophysomyces ossiformis]
MAEQSSAGVSSSPVDPKNASSNDSITPTTPNGDSPSDTNTSQDSKKKRTGPKRRKVTHGRPCQRCIKRSIGHLCHDEPKYTNQQQQKNRSTTNTTTPANNYMLTNMANNGTGTNLGGLPLQFFGQMGTGQLRFASEHMGNEISVISDFLDSLGGDTQAIYNQRQQEQPQPQHPQQQPHQQQQQQTNTATTVNTTEKFFLTAADPSDGKLEDRLTEVINAKYEAGFLKPYNYVNGYARLQKYMDNNMSASSRQRILNVMGTFRPAFRSVAQSLTDIDLILVEEAFERLLLDYDRVFSSMGIPACLWRRTGEIYKGNKEFASLVNVPIETLREGRLCIYELMAEESAVNYWEKYGNIAFDPGQKAVLTSCLLKSPDPENTSVMSCCFSFTIRRDKYNIPTVIVGNFLPVQLQ